MEDNGRMVYEPVPHWTHEKDMARMERSNKRVWALAIILAFALVATNAYWIWNESQYEDVCIEAEQNGGGTNLVSGGDLSYGAEGEN